jgi:CRISPR type III-A-associated RAMP protein Csm4
MNPGLVVKLRPNGPWRIGPDSGARSRVDAIYHSDSLYSAVTAAMARLDSLDAWLDATARHSVASVCFSSCFPFLGELGLIVPPRTIWPPVSPSLMSAHVRWKSARFVPLEVVQGILRGQPPDENRWNVDGPSECLVPAGSPGPFRTGIRWNAAVDRLSGVTERHSTACIEFRSGAGLWAAVSFQDQAAHERWLEPVKAAFRLLADTGLGGERSRGWGRSESPEFIDGVLPDMILAVGQAPAPREPDSEPPAEAAPCEVGQAAGPSAQEPAQEPYSTAAAEAVMEAESPAASPNLELHAPVHASEPPSPEESAMESESPAALPVTPPSDPHLPPPDPEPRPTPAPPEPEPEPGAPPEPGPEIPEPPPEPIPVPPLMPEPVMSAAGGPRPHWLLSLFTPAPDETVDWARGNYTLVARGGRVESPAGSGELKKQVQMVSEGSVLYAAEFPRGSAADVAPDGFAHPVYRAGFALSIRLPEGI